MEFLSNLLRPFENQTLQLSLFSFGLGFLLFLKDKKADLIDKILMMVGGLGLTLWVLEFIGIKGYFEVGFTSEDPVNLLTYALNMIVYVGMIAILSVLPITLIKDKRSGDTKKEPVSTITLVLLISVVVFSIIPQMSAKFFAGASFANFVLLFLYALIVYGLTTPSSK